VYSLAPLSAKHLDHILNARTATTKHILPGLCQPICTSCWTYLLREEKQTPQLSPIQQTAAAKANSHANCHALLAASSPLKRILLPTAY
jgi:hypothetical protein